MGRITRFVHPIETRRGSGRLQSLRELYLHLKQWADRHHDIDDSVEVRLDGKLTELSGDQLGLVEFNLALSPALLRKHPEMKEYCRTYRLEAATQLFAVRQFLALCDQHLLNEPRNEAAIFEFTFSETGSDREPRHRLALRGPAGARTDVWHCTALLKPSSGRRYA